MNKLSNELILEIKDLRKQGESYKTISKKLCTSSANVYKYSKDVALSNEQIQNLEINNANNRKTFTSKFAVDKKIRFPDFNEDFVFVLGHLFFDGSVSKSIRGDCVLNYTNASIELINDFILKMKKCFGITGSKIQKFMGVGVDYYEVNFCSKKAHGFVIGISSTFSTKVNIGVPKQVFSSDEKLLGIFLQTFWDDEGCFSNGRLIGTSKSEKMIDDLVLLHNRLGIACTKTKATNGCFNIRISSVQSNLRIFSKKVNFSKSIVARGHHIGRYKRDLLEEWLALKVANL